MSTYAHDVARRGSRGIALLSAAVASSCLAVLLAAPAAQAGPPAPPVTPPLPGVTTSPNTEDYPKVRVADAVRIRFDGVHSVAGGVIGVEPGLTSTDLNNGSVYAPCKGKPTALPTVVDPVYGGEPYKAACENTTEPSYYRSGPFTGGLGKQAPQFPHGIVMGNSDMTRACVVVCQHHWAERLTRFDVEIYLKKRLPSGALVTDFDYVRPRFSVGAFPHRSGNGMLSADFGTIRPLKAYERGTARLQGVIFADGTTRAEGNRVRVSMFENDANGRTSTGQLLQAFAVFTASGGYYSTGTVYAGSYKLRLTDLETGRCVVLKHLPLPSMGIRVDLHLDRPNFGVPRARTIPCG